jgi:hypothetical protein
MHERLLLAEEHEAEHHRAEQSRQEEACDLQDEENLEETFGGRLQHDDSLEGGRLGDGADKLHEAGLEVGLSESSPPVRVQGCRKAIGAVLSNIVLDFGHEKTRYFRMRLDLIDQSLLVGIQLVVAFDGGHDKRRRRRFDTSANKGVSGFGAVGLASGSDRQSRLLVICVHVR